MTGEGYSPPAECGAGSGQSYGIDPLERGRPLSPCEPPAAKAAGYEEAKSSSEDSRFRQSPQGDFASSLAREFTRRARKPPDANDGRSIYPIPQTQPP